MIGVEKVVGCRLTQPRAVKVGGCAHDDHTGEIDDALDRGAEHGFESCIVFLSGGAVDAAAIGDEICVVAEGIA